MFTCTNARSRAAAVVAGGLLLCTACALDPVDLEAERRLPLRTSMVAADGSLLVRLYKQNRSLVRYGDIPSVLVDAVVATEDARFFEHEGYDLKSIARAALANLEEGDTVQGGSTITQQYVKNTFFRHPDRSFERKARELRLAMEVEDRYSKQEILERYLNTIYFGDGAYGIKAAAETYFGHGLTRMTLPQAALLAALIKAPAVYDPRDHPATARLRRNYVLKRMAKLDVIAPAQLKRARRAPLGITLDPPKPTARQPYFVEAVKQEVLSDRRLGTTEQERARALFRGGLRVTTTLEPRLQRAAERSISAILDRPGDPAAAMVAIRPQTGAIVAMVGGKNWSASQVNLALGTAGGGSGRQPGSAFKPIVAAAALENRMLLTTPYESSEVTFHFEDGSTWPVHNAEGGGSGLLSIEEGLVHSVNGVFARLAVELGPAQITTQARLMGVRSKLPNYPSIALGSAEVSVLDMGAAYATLANGGVAVEPTTIREVRLPDGEVLKADQKVQQGALSPGNAYLVTKALEQVIKRGTGAAAAIGRPAAGKTGTTNDYSDAWFVGYTPDLVAAVWVGYPQGRVPMTAVHGIRVQGGTFPAQIWRSFMVEALENEPVRGFNVPAGDLVTVEIDPASGLLAASWCPGEPQTMLRQLVPSETCPLPPAPTPTPAASPMPLPTSTRDIKADRSDNRETTSRGVGAPSPSPEPPAETTRRPSPQPKPTPEPSPTKSGGRSREP